MIDGKTLFDWWEESWPDAPRWGWDSQISIVQHAFIALAKRINLEVAAQQFGITLKDWQELGDVIPLGALPPGTEVQVSDTMIVLTDEGIKQLSKDTYRAAVENTLVASPPTSILKDPQAAYDKFKDNSLIGKMATATSNEYSTHHKSCALRHDGITCTCP